MSRIKAVLFDLDDTLVKTWVVKWQQHKFVAKKYYGIDLTDQELTEHWGKPISRLLQDLYRNFGEPQTRIDNYMRHADEFPKIVHDDTEATLEALKKAGIKMGVVTSTFKQSVTDVFKSHGLSADYFVHIQGAEESDYHKPDPRVFDPALSKLAEHGITDGIVYVGDAIMDYEAAKAAGLHFVGVTTGMVNAAEFKAVGALQVISRLSELPAVLQM